MDDNEYTKTFDDALNRIAELEAELAALRPWAEVGKRAVREQWWWNEGIETYCCVCSTIAPDHDSDCPIPALVAQLDADNAR